MSITDKHSDRASVGRSMSIAVLIMAASNLLSRVLGYVRIASLGAFVGAGPEADAYVFSFIIPDLLNHLLAGSALSITFIPIFQKLLANGKKEEAWRFFSNLMTLGTILFVIFTLVGEVFTDRILMLAGENIHDPDNPEKFRLTVYLTRIILPAQIFFFWGALLNGVQYAHRRFFLPSLAPLLYNIGIIAGGILLRPVLNVDAEGFSWGVLAGAFTGNVLVQIPGVMRTGLKYRPRLDIGDSNLRRYILMTLPLTLGMGMTFSNEFLSKYVGSFVENGEGVLASLDYAYKLTFVFVGVFGQGTAAGLYPFISKMAVERKLDEVGALLNKVLQRLAALAFPIAAVCAALGPQVVAVALQRGRFDAEATNATADNFTLYMGGAFFFSSVLVIYRVFFAMKNTLLPMIVSTASVTVSLPVYILMARAMGGPGIALSVSFSALLQFGIIYGLWNRRTYCSSLQTIRVIILSAGISVAGGLVCRQLKEALVHLGFGFEHILIHNLAFLALAGIPSLLIIYLVLHWLKIFDIVIVLKELRGKKSASINA
jgi:putative peptidoglycan lipid II flippase